MFNCGQSNVFLFLIIILLLLSLALVIVQATIKNKASSSYYQPLSYQPSHHQSHQSHQLHHQPSYYQPSHHQSYESQHSSFMGGTNIMDAIVDK